jgi:hypothetical protein
MKPQFPLALVAAVLMMAAKPHPATASLITYDLSSNASATFPEFGGDVIALTGSFTFDTTTNEATTAANITGTCTAGTVCPHPQNDSPVVYTDVSASDPILIHILAPADVMTINFSTPITGTNASPIGSVNIDSFIAGTVAGSVSPVPAPNAGAGVPGLLACGLAFLFWRGCSAAMALIRRRQRLFEPVAS